jgi:putative ABC transport system substrate-binding protein
VKRRGLATALSAAALGNALGGPRALAQALQRELRRVGVLTATTPAAFAVQAQALRDGLRDHGWVEGRDVVIADRYADGRAEDLARLAAELAALAPAVIVATGAAATDAARAAAPTTPIVSIGDLVAAGHAATLARPGGHVTGVSFLPLDLNVKRLELLAALLPKGSAVLNLGYPPASAAMQAVDAAGRALGLVTHAAYATTPVQIDAAFDSARMRRVAGVNVLNSPFLSSHHPRIVALAAAAKLPAIYQWPETARDGGLMGYGPSLGAMFRLLAGYVARILAGAKPADLPVEQPTKFELVINLKTAKALGLAIPQSVLLRADEVIE